MAALSVCHCQAHLDHGVSGEEKRLRQTSGTMDRPRPSPLDLGKKGPMLGPAGMLDVGQAANAQSFPMLSGGPVNRHCSARKVEAWTQPANAGPLAPQEWDISAGFGLAFGSCVAEVWPF